MNNTYQIYLISDSTGETLDRIFLALKAQFKDFNYKIHQYYMLYIYLYSSSSYFVIYIHKYFLNIYYLYSIFEDLHYIRHGNKQIYFLYT